MPKLIDRLPAVLADRLRTKTGTQMVRFVLVAAVSLGASQIALFLFVGPMHLTGGVSGVLAAIVGAIVSYFLSRWAWERKGRPNVWRETIPFWLVSVGVWLILGLAAHFGTVLAGPQHLNLHHFERHFVVGGIYLLANCVTFVIRFLIFHYVLFADRGDKGGPTGPAAESLSPVTVPASGEDRDQQG